jgi:hypothetical protein
MLNLLFIGDIVGEPGRRAVIDLLPSLKEQYELDFVVANAENAAAGRGLTPKLAQVLLNAGAHVLTMGDHVWDQPDLAPWLSPDCHVLRPLNYPEGTPGVGSIVVDTPKGKVAVMQLQGRTFIQPPLENPFLMGLA